jgi:hypothetical protein
MGHDTWIPVLGGWVGDYQLDVNVQDRHRLLAADVLGIGLQETL